MFQVEAYKGYMTGLFIRVVATNKDIIVFLFTGGFSYQFKMVSVVGLFMRVVA